MREAGIVSAAELARRTKVKDVTMRTYVNGERNPPLDVAERIGASLGVYGRYIFDGTGPKYIKAADNKLHKVPLVGYVSAGAEAHLFSDGQGPFDMVDAPDNPTDKTVAVEIRGTSLGALFDRWLAFYDNVSDPPHDGLVGRVCVVGLEDGRIVVKLLQRGRDQGTWDLLANTEPPIYGVNAIWAAPVSFIRARKR